MSFLWMHVICCWGYHGNIIEKSYMMEGIILTPYRMMDLRSYYFPLWMKVIRFSYALMVQRREGEEITIPIEEAKVLEEKKDISIAQENILSMGQSS